MDIEDELKIQIDEIDKKIKEALEKKRKYASELLIIDTQILDEREKREEELGEKMVEEEEEKELERKKNKKKKTQKEEKFDKMATIGNGVEVRTSTIANSGNGLFATRDFEKNEPITRYEGEIISKKDAEKLEKQKKNSHFISYQAQHSVIVGLNDPTISQGRGGASFANDGKRDERYPYNAVFDSTEQSEVVKVIFLKALVPIKNGQEIFVNYGNTYWKRDAEQNEDDIEKNQIISKHVKDGVTTQISFRFKNKNISFSIDEMNAIHSKMSKRGIDRETGIAEIGAHKQNLSWTTGICYLCYTNADYELVRMKYNNQETDFSNNNINLLKDIMWTLKLINLDPGNVDKNNDDYLLCNHCANSFGTSNWFDKYKKITNDPQQAKSQAPADSLQPKKPRIVFDPYLPNRVTTFSDFRYLSNHLDRSTLTRQIKEFMDYNNIYLL